MNFMFMASKRQFVNVQRKIEKHEITIQVLQRKIVLSNMGFLPNKFGIKVL